MILSTTNEIFSASENQTVRNTLGVVSAVAVVGKKINSDAGHGLNALLGKDSRRNSDVIENAISIATKKLEKKAKEMGADAIIGISVVTSNMMNHAAEVIVYGTAVTLEY